MRQLCLGGYFEHESINVEFRHGNSHGRFDGSAAQVHDGDFQSGDDS